MACAAHHGRPQDVEWAIENGVLYLLQSRPITTLGTVSASDDLLTIWDNSNIVESYPGLVSPLTFSFARYVYANVYRLLLRLLGVRGAVISGHRPVLENLLGRIDGHVYYNLLNWYRTLSLLPGFAHNSRFMEQMMGVAEPLPQEATAALRPTSVRGLRRIAMWAQVALVAGGLSLRAVTLPAMIRRFENRLRLALDPPADLASSSLTDLARAYRRLESALLENWDAPLVNDLICMIAFGLSRRCLEKWAGAEGLALHNEVMIGQGDIISAEPAQRIRAMSALARRKPELIAALRAGDDTLIAGLSPALAAGIEAYLLRFGDRCPEELKLESIPLTVDPAPLRSGHRRGGGRHRQGRPVSRD